jgi:pimeloyl-ACP methyl ester carboxylesterase
MSKKGLKNNQGIEIPRFIIGIAQGLQLVSTKATVKFVAKLFTTPIKYKTPKREQHMVDNSRQERILIPSTNKFINLYHYGKPSDKRILLVHGWSGRGTQLYKIADAFVEKGYSIISFDAPAHGKSEGKTSMMPKFIESIHVIDDKYGPFEFAIGHSLGGMSILNAVKKGFKVKKVVTIGSADKISDIVKNFIDQLRLKKEIAPKLTAYFENKLGEKMEDYATHLAVENIEIPLLIIHDTNDIEVPAFTAHNIHKHAKNSELFLTEALGHRKILGSDEVVAKIVEFLN